MIESDRIPLAGVLGSPVSHSLSPKLHGHWLSRYGIEGYYVPMDVAPADLPEAIRTMSKLGFAGANVTIPHKEAVLELADMVTDRAAVIGAANTLAFREDGRIHADNTDGHGFVENLRRNAPDWDPAAGPAAVVGAGGATRAVLASLIELGVREIRLANRTRARAEALADAFGPKVKVFSWIRAGDMLEGVALMVNASSLGMVGKADYRVPLDALPSRAVVCDLVYVPLRTALLERAEEIGCATVDGLGMLLHQATPGFERWFGVRPEVDDELRRAVLA